MQPRARGAVFGTERPRLTRSSWVRRDVLLISIIATRAMQPERRGRNVYAARKNAPRALLAPGRKSPPGKTHHGGLRAAAGGEAAPCEMQVIISHASPLMKAEREAAESETTRRDQRRSHCPAGRRGTRWPGSGPLRPWINCDAKTHGG